MNVLFVCNQGMHRSKTAEKLFRRSFETKSAGLFSEKPLAEAEMQWADTIIVMEEFQRAELMKRFPALFMQKRVLTLGIPDIYLKDQPELVAALKEKMKLLKPLVKLP